MFCDESDRFIKLLSRILVSNSSFSTLTGAYPPPNEEINQIKFNMHPILLKLTALVGVEKNYCPAAGQFS